MPLKVFLTSASDVVPPRARMSVRHGGIHLQIIPAAHPWVRTRLLNRHRTTRYEILVANPNGASRGVVATTLDGTALPEGNPRIQLLNDGATHRIEMILG